MQIIVDGLLTHYERAGKGPIVVILPGWADTSRSWLAMQKELSGSYDVVVLDIPGFGGSQAPNIAWSLDDYTDFISHFLEKTGSTDLYAVIGHSNGGAMAIRGIGSAKFAPRKLVLLASAGIRAGQSGRRGLLKIVAKAGKVLSTPLPATLKSRLRARLYHTVGSDMLVAGHMQETFKKVVADDVQAEAVRVTVPTLLIYGDSDNDTPLKYGEAFHRLIKGSTLEVIPGAGHFLHTENASQVGRIAKEFLR